ncbi:MAG: hypothetical protein CTY25_05995 [Methylobacterium sp.]|nr:MAG: hypothetical protein CTY25_05995 [Methylobacterium sp.]
MTKSFLHEPFESLLGFYKHAYGQYIVENHTLGSRRSTLLAVEQSAGDWSDAPTQDLVLCCVTSGRTPMTMNIGVGRRAAVMWPGSFFIIPPNFATTFLVDVAHRGEFVALNFRRLLDATGGEESDLPPDGDFGWLHGPFHTDKYTLSAMDALWREARSGNPHGSLGVDGTTLQLMGALLALRDAKPAAPARSGLAPWQLRRVFTLFEDRLADDIALPELAALVGLSPSHFCRAFARSTGMPPHRWRMRRRIERAKELLANGTLSVTNVALCLGFSTPQHFAAAFRAQVGTTPSDWRRDRLS